ncbi:MAG: hypothetical protein M0R06_00840 [Sphaerochaeta sp.]|jgi:hypothetical protein|nr:hypothetical protein [Sphaerochaeta sp.]
MGMVTPTASETVTALMKVCEESQRALREIGRIEGRNATGSEKELLEVIVRRSKAILQAMPYLQLNDDVLEGLDSKICHRLNKIEEEDE